MRRIGSNGVMGDILLCKGLPREVFWARLVGCEIKDVYNSPGIDLLHGSFLIERQSSAARCRSLPERQIFH